MGKGLKRKQMVEISEKNPPSSCIIVRACVHRAALRVSKRWPKSCQQLLMMGALLRTVDAWVQPFYCGFKGMCIVLLEIKPCGLGSRIRDMEAEWRLKVINDLISY